MLGDLTTWDSLDSEEMINNFLKSLRKSLFSQNPHSEESLVFNAVTIIQEFLTTAVNFFYGDLIAKDSLGSIKSLILAVRDLKRKGKGVQSKVEAILRVIV